MVVFEQGVPRKAFYRRFNIRSVHGPDDYASMEEVLSRRLNRWKAAQEAQDTPGKKVDPAFAILPDLLIVDGGKGQLGRAIEVLVRFDLLGKIPVAGLAKQNEELFLPERATPLVLSRTSQALYLIQRIRDEAHRFAVTAHRSRRAKLGLASRLDKVPGIGPSRRKALLERFGSIEGILAASPEEISEVNGITPMLAQIIHETLE
jgi:excinuclease ABC subunit C